jgi:hypothetical protein
MPRSDRIEMEITRNGRFVAKLTARPEDAAEALADWLSAERYDEGLWHQFRVRVPGGLGKQEVSAA